MKKEIIVSAFKDAELAAIEEIINLLETRPVDACRVIEYLKMRYCFKALPK